MGAAILKRSGDFHCLSSPFLILPFFDNCLPIQTSWGTCKVGIELGDPRHEYPGLRWSDIDSKAFDLTSFYCLALAEAVKVLEAVYF